MRSTVRYTVLIAFAALLAAAASIVSAAPVSYNIDPDHMAIAAQP